MEKREVPKNPVIKAVFFDVDGTLLSIESNQVPDSAKEAADYVTDTVEDHGIEKALKHFGLIS